MAFRTFSHGEVGTAHAKAVAVSKAFDVLDVFQQLHPHGEWVEKHASAERLTAIALRLMLAIAVLDPDGVDTLRCDSGRL